MSAIGVNVQYRFSIARIATIFGIVAYAFFSASMTAYAQDAADEEIMFDEEFAVNEEIIAENGAEDEFGFFDAVGDFFGNVKDAVVDVVTDAYRTTTDFFGFGDKEAAIPEEVAETFSAPMPATAPSPEGVDAPTSFAAPAVSSFVLRVVIAADDVAAVLRSARNPEPVRYEPRAFDIPGRGLVTVHASQDGPLFCLAFDLAELRVATALETASFEIGGVKGMVEDGGVNTVCVGLPALSARTLVIEGVFE